MAQQSKHLNALLALLQKESQISVEVACAELGFSEATCRRVFGQLEGDGLVERYWGGIQLPNSYLTNQTSVYQRQTSNLEAKIRIAKRASEMVENGDVIILDGGTTTAQMVPFLAEMKIRVITNSILIAQAFDHLRAKSNGPEILVTGGWLFQELGVLTGPETRETLRRYHAQKLFLSPAGLDENYLTNHHPDIVETEQTMIQQAKECIILADSSKIGLKHMCNITTTEMAHSILLNASSESIAFQSKLKNPTSLILVNQ
jgi:DeoR/GlpR family transcriptional regulator of sugar metabolism